jgi:hypothetical protein
MVAELSVCQQFRAAGRTYVFQFCSAFKTKIRLRSVLLIALATMHRLILYSSTHVSRCARFETGKGFHDFDIVLGEGTGFLLDRFASTNGFVRHVPKSAPPAPCRALAGLRIDDGASSRSECICLMLDIKVDLSLSVIKAVSTVASNDQI